MGFGRSGTSLMAGILHYSGYFLGSDLYPTRESNPFGFFENAFINGINESILRDFDYCNFHSEPVFSKPFSPYHPGEGHRWLSFIPGDISINISDDLIINNIREAIEVSGFAYKDPRFNYTLGIWNNLIKDDTVMICMFRQPEITIGSVLRECEFATYLSDFYIDVDMAYQLWLNSYMKLLQNLNSISNDRILFIHYEQLLNGEVLPDLEDRLGTRLDSTLINKSLNRSKPIGNVPADVLRVYREMCERSGFRS